MIKKVAITIAAGFAAVAINAAVAGEPAHHHRFAQDVDAFHAELAPVWHMPPSPQRLQNACAKAADLNRLAKAIRSRDASRLVLSTTTFEAKCQKPRGDAEAAFGDVHEAFHRLIEG